ncbi:FecR family protein [Parapedobacter lycopersici]|uniref:FecR family protein n=1 Tax=Parapedobacter lycopersici TaxID=1864939 RepID=UPI00214D9019|nr:FecR domain-containing protein [Parapedobacter lycopersici]
MDTNKLRQLLADYMAETISKPDLIMLLDYVAAKENGVQLDQLMNESLLDLAPDPETAVDSAALYQRIISHSQFNRQPIFKKRRYWKWVGAAAAVLVVAGVFFWGVGGSRYSETGSLQGNNRTPVLRTVTTAPSDIPVLRLADGRVINLDSVAGGVLALEDGMQITLEGNQLHYEGGDTKDAEGKTLKNTIITPKGRQYQVILPDGSKMWLNAATTLTYPVQFDRDKRVVEISGEAYFEVQKAANWPFIVKTKTQQVEVLGTHFNVSAYDGDQKAKTTLVEGSVKVSLVRPGNGPNAHEPSTVLKPGQQATTYLNKEAINVDAIDPYEAVSWKENLFVFNNEEISEIMKKVSRWYDVEVVYQDGMAGKRIGGTIPRFAQINELMDALMATGLLRYKMEGGRVVIME